jgi:exopolysaccharide biosynthesis protein
MVGPGMVYYRLVAPSVPWSIDMLVVDLKNPYLKIEAAKARDLRAGGRETTSAIAARRNRPGHQVVGAINADFFNLGTGETSGVHVGAGEIVRRENPNHPAIGFDAANRPQLSRPVVGGTLRTRAGSLAIGGYNEARTNDRLVLYNRYIGAATGTNAFGTEVRVRPVSAWIVNDTLRVVAEAIENGVGNMQVPQGKAVLSGHGTAAAFLQASVRVGDTLRLYQRVLPGIPRLTEMVGGNPILVQRGMPAALDNSAFNVDRHPRTAVGFTADTTRLYLITVDGRQSISAGMSNFELRELLLRLGIAEGFNLDGGGSTAMVVQGAIMNAPSDSGVERPVGNALLAISTAPAGPMVTLKATPTNSRVFLGGNVQLAVTGNDAFYNPATIDPARVSYRVAPQLGTVSASGLFTAGGQAGTGYVVASYEGLLDSVRVTVKGVGRLSLTPAQALTDATRPLQLRAQIYDTDGLAQSVAPTSIVWRVTDPRVGDVDASGVFRGRAMGTTLVIARHEGGAADTSSVRVELATGTRVLDSFDTLGAWRVTGAAIDTAGTRLTIVDDPRASGGRAFRVHYRFTQSANALGMVHLNHSLPLYGVPDSISLSFRSDGANHRLFFEFEDGSGAAFTVGVPKIANDSSGYVNMSGSFDRATIPPERLVFPVRLRQIRLQLGYKGGAVAGKTYESDVYVDHLRVVYPGVSTGHEATPSAPGGLVLTGSAPNPFSDRTTVYLQTERTQPVRLVLYDALGREQGVIFDGVLAPGRHGLPMFRGVLAPGVYILRAFPAATPLLLVVGQ